MARKTEGATARSKLVAFRLNTEESEELLEKSGARGLDTSNYFRTLMQEDEGPQ